MSVRYKIFGLSYKLKQQQQKSFHLLTWGQQGEERIWCEDQRFSLKYIRLEMEKAMAPHSSTLAWRIPWMEEPGGLQSMGSLGVGHD